MNHNDQQILAILVLLFLWLAVKYRRPWRGSGNAHGTARWATEAHLEFRKMFADKGLIIGRTLRRGRLIRMNKYVHTAVYAPTGAGKGVSFVISTLLSYTAGSILVFDYKAELYRASAKARAVMGQRVYVLDPFGLVTSPGESDCYNPLDAVPSCPTLVDEARAMGEAMIVRAPEGDKDPHWNNSAAMLLTTMLTATLLFMRIEDRNLATLREMMTDPAIFKAVIIRLQAMGGIPARMANQLAKQAESEKEIAGVISTANTHASFLDSEMVASVLNTSTFSADVLLKPGSTVYVILPVEQLEAQRGFLRLIVSSFIRHILRNGVKRGGECLFLLDECSALSGLDALAQAFVLGRGAGIRLYTFWQSVEQAQVAFKKTPNLVSDNSDAQLYFGINSYATADLVSKTLGTWTMVAETANENTSGSRSYSSGSRTGTYQTSWSSGRNYSEHARPLLNASEVIQLSGEYVIALIKGVPPILARRIKFYSDPVFRRSSSAVWSILWCLLFATGIALLAWSVLGH